MPIPMADPHTVSPSQSAVQLSLYNRRRGRNPQTIFSYQHWYIYKCVSEELVYYLVIISQGGDQPEHYKQGVMQVTGGRYRYYNIWRPIMTSSLKYCLTQELNPFDYSNELGTLSLYLTLGMLALPLPYIIYQISKLCKIAYSYSNFYLYESYKLYSLVLITSITIMISRAVVIKFRQKIGEEPHSERFPNYEGWMVFNEVVGLFSIYATNLMYIFNSCTVILASKNLDRSWRQYNPDEGQDEQVENKHQQYINHMRFRKLLLYLFVPLCMSISVFGQLTLTEWSCLTARIITVVCNLVTWALIVFAYARIYREMRNSETLTRKTKAIWLYIVVSMCLRQAIALYFASLTFSPKSAEFSRYHELPFSNSLDFLAFAYTLFISTIPIFLLSIQAETYQKNESNSLQNENRLEYTKRLLHSTSIL